MTFAILIELPLTIKKELLRLCYGLPSAEWEAEQNLFIILTVLNKLTPTQQWDLVDSLGEIIATPFSLKIKNLNYRPQRKNLGYLWAEIEHSQELDKLKKTVESQIRRLNLEYQLPNHQSQGIRLAMIQKESPERLANYFEANGNFQSSSFEIQEIVFSQLKQTDKNSFYTIEKRYPFV